MTLRDRLQSPKALVRVGMLCLLVGIVAPRLLHPATALGSDWLDAARGVLYGASIALNLFAARRSGRRHCGEEG